MSSTKSARQAVLTLCDGSRGPLFARLMSLWADSLSCGSAQGFTQQVTGGQRTSETFLSTPSRLLWVSFETPTGLAQKVGLSGTWGFRYLLIIPGLWSCWPETVLKLSLAIVMRLSPLWILNAPKDSQVLFASIFCEEEGTTVDLWWLEIHQSDSAPLEIVGYSKVTEPRLEWGFLFIIWVQCPWDRNSYKSSFFSFLL